MIPSAKSHTNDRGASGVSTLIILVLVLMILDLTAMGARVASAHHDIQSAVREGARQGTLAKSGSTATNRMQTVANGNLADLPCVKDSMVIDAGPFEGGGSVGIRATCDVQLADLSFLRLPWPTITVAVEVNEIIDTYRAVD